MPRSKKASEVRSRVSEELKRKVQAMALMKGDEENESLVVREALVWYFQRPDVAALLEDGLARLDAKAAERHKGGGHGGGHGGRGR